MTFIATCDEPKTYTIRPGDPNFNIQGKFTVSRRASIEISPKCPQATAQFIAEAMRMGYLIPVATITEREKLFIGLADE